MTRLRTVGLAVLSVLLLAALMVFLFRGMIGSAFITHFTKDFMGPRPAFETTARPVTSEWVEMRDGTQLFTRVYLPKGEGPWPTLLVRDAYQFQRFLTCHYYVRYGFACVHQDVRGQGESEGEWYPIKHEASDGQDTLSWLLKQDFQDGNLALIGGSYLGLAQWAVAASLPEEVKTIVPTTSHGDFYEMIYRNGNFTQGVAGLWAAEIFYPLAEKQDAADRWMAEIVPIRPANDAPRDVFKGAWASYADYIAHPDKADPYWQQDFYTDLRDAHHSVNVPVLWIARWHDFFLEGTLSNFTELPSRDESLLLIQPGQHAGLTADLNYNNIDFTEFATTLDWLNHHLKGAPLPDDLSGRVVYYENGADTWGAGDVWPPEGGESLSLHLTQLSDASHCGGVLSSRMPEGDAAPARFSYDPDRPVPTKGGAFMLNPNFAPSAVTEQGDEACARDDVLNFRSDAFANGLHIAGDIRVDLAISTSAPDTTFTVKLSEVFADGRVWNIRDDITTLSAAGVTGPGEAEITLDLAPIDWVLQPGSKLRLDISSSNFPAFPAHSNKAGLWSDVESVDLADQVVASGVLSLSVIR